MIADLPSFKLLLPAFALAGAVTLSGCNGDGLPASNTTPLSSTARSEATLQPVDPAASPTEESSTQSTPNAFATKTLRPLPREHQRENSPRSAQLSVKLAGDDVPPNATCHVVAENRDQVLSGGAGIAGAPIRVGSIRMAQILQTEILPGAYRILADCASGPETWHGESDVNLRTQNQIEAEIHMAIAD